LWRLVHTRGVFVEAIELVDAALAKYGAAGADLADYLIVAVGGKAGARELVTFDRRLARERGVRIL
jgi:predicted nucleic-acid-binding protein